uniref:Uncharacterized protein n=1 Tax=Arundo donax TaxID=35708 RepID=A0A0A9GJY0_ARUDO
MLVTCTGDKGNNQESHNCLTQICVINRLPTRLMYGVLMTLSSNVRLYDPQIKQEIINQTGVKAAAKY